MPRSLAVLAQVLREPTVIRLEVAFGAFNLAEYGVWVTVLVYAFGRGGTTATALVAVAQLVPAGALAPRLATLLQRCGASSALRRGYAIQVVSFTLLAVSLLADTSAAIVYVTAVIAAIAVTLTRPAQAVLVPTIIAAPAQLTAVNVASGWVESLCVLAGPGIAGLMIAAAGPGAAVCLFAAGMALATLVCPGRKPAEVTSHQAADRAEHEADRPAPDKHPSSAEAPVWPVVWLLGAEYAVIGIVDVLSVFLAIRVLALGPSGAGYLNAAFGAGGAIGAAIAATLIGQRRLAAPLCVAGAAWSAVMAVLALTHTRVGVFVLLACAGSARTVLDACGRTILMRTPSAAARAHIFGRLEALTMFGLAVGSLLVPALLTAGHVSSPLAGASALLALTTLAVVAYARPPHTRQPERPQMGPIPSTSSQTIAFADKKR